MFVAVVLTDSQMSGFSAIKIKQLSNRWVAPHVGAWIETISSLGRGQAFVPNISMAE